MPLQALISRPRFRLFAPMLLASGLAFFSGCGEGDGTGSGGAGVGADASPSRNEQRRKDIEESKKEPVGKSKGSKSRS